MRFLETVKLEDVQAVYSGPECELWELIMGSQIHMGGLQSSQQLANCAAIVPNSRGVDLCCCKGAGMLFLARFRGIGRVTGVDATEGVVQQGRQIVDRQGFSERIEFVQADAVNTGLPAGAFDFAWGEDAWCYVSEKPALIEEAARLVRPGGKIAFTDWVEGPTPLSDDEARRFMGFMKFPSLATMGDYSRMLEQSGCRVECSEDTGRFAPCIDLYMSMIEQQLAWDALAIIGFDQSMLEAILGEMAFAGRLAREGKLVQGMFVAAK
jgi:ubiquinone/menaquinone biosynthesis C-methylase UbiE